MTFGVVVYGTRYSRGRAQALPLFFFGTGVTSRTLSPPRLVKCLPLPTGAISDVLLVNRPPVVASRHLDCSWTVCSGKWIQSTLFFCGGKSPRLQSLHECVSNRTRGTFLCEEEPSLSLRCAYGRYDTTAGRQHVRKIGHTKLNDYSK